MAKVQTTQQELLDIEKLLDINKKEGTKKEQNKVWRAHRGTEKAETPKHLSLKEKQEQNLNSPVSFDKTKLANAVAYEVWLIKETLKRLTDLFNREKVRSLPFSHYARSFIDFGERLLLLPQPEPESIDDRYAKKTGDFKDTIDDFVKVLIKKFSEAMSDYRQAKDALDESCSKMYKGLKKLCNDSRFNLSNNIPTEDEAKAKFIELANTHNDRIQKAHTAEDRQVAEQETKSNIKDLVKGFFGNNLAEEKYEIFVEEVFNKATAPQLLIQVSVQDKEVKTNEARVRIVLSDLQETALHSTKLLKQNPELMNLVEDSKDIQQQVHKNTTPSHDSSNSSR
jgi:hypothetical protein